MIRQALVSHVIRYGGQLGLARALLDFFAGIDPSGAGVVRTLLTLIPSRGGHSDQTHRTPAAM